MNNLKKILIAAVVIVVLLIALLVNMFITSKQTQPAAESINNSQTNLQTNNTSEQEEKFIYEYVAKNTGGSTDDGYDGAITQTSLKDGKKTTLIASVKSAYPALKAQFNLTFLYLNQSQTKPYLYFTTIYMDTDGGAMDLVRFDAATKKFTKLKISSQFGGANPMEGVSKDSAYAAIVIPEFNNNVSDARKLSLLNFDADSIKLLTTLPASQTFDYCVEEGLGCPAERIKWLDASNFQIDVYDPKTQAMKDGYPEHKFLKTIKFNVNE